MPAAYPFFAMAKFAIVCVYYVPLYCCVTDNSLLHGDDLHACSWKHTHTKTPYIPLLTSASRASLKGWWCALIKNLLHAMPSELMLQLLLLWKNGYMLEHAAAHLAVLKSSYPSSKCINYNHSVLYDCMFVLQVPRSLLTLSVFGFLVGGLLSLSIVLLIHE